MWEQSHAHSLHTVRGCYHVMMAELSTCNRNCVSWKARSLYYLVLEKACRPLPYLFSRPLSHIFPNSSITQTPELPTSLAQVNLHLGFPGGASGKEQTCQCRRCKRRVFDPWVEKIPWRRAWQPTPVFLPGESNGHRRLVGYSP